MKKFLRALFFSPKKSHAGKVYKRLSQQSGSILDIGCGTGMLVQYGPDRIVGLDYNPGSLEFIRGKYSARCVRANAVGLPFADASFHAVNCSDLIEHMEPDDAVALLGEISRVLKPDGTAAISSNGFHRAFYNDPSHIRPYPPESVISIIQSHRVGELTSRTYFQRIDLEFVDMFWRYGSLAILPYYLRADTSRKRIGSWIRPGALWFMFANVLARCGIRKYWAKTHYTMFLRKV